MNHLFVFCFISASFIINAQRSNTQITLNKIIEHTQNASLYRNNVEWKLLKKEIYAMAKEADSVVQLKPAIEYMINRIGDTHGRVFYNNTYLAYYRGDQKETPENIDWDIYNEIQSGQVYKFKIDLLNDNIGYVRIVGLPMGDNQKMSTEIQDAICEQIIKGAKTWIVDLRFNGGGNMFPMVEGITSIIGNGLVGGTKGLTDNESSVWQIKNGDFYYDDQNVAIANKCPMQESPKVAVLTSNYTASSGEALAVIFKQRENTRFFGQRTYGMITATDYKQLDSLTAMAISVSYYSDRNGNIYKKYVDVDEDIKFEPKTEFKEDTTINRAIEWINNN